MVLCVPAAHPLASAASRCRCADLDGAAPARREPARDAYTDLLVERDRGGRRARWRLVEARVTGGAAFLTELGQQDLVALMPAGHRAARGDRDACRSTDFAVPLVLLWPAGLPSAAVERLRLAL